MDVLSQVVGAMRTGEPRSYVVECHSPWARRYTSVPGAGLHVVLEGSVWLLTPERTPVRLAVGDVVLMPSGLGHALADPPESPVIDLEEDPQRTRERNGRVVIGPDASTTGSRSLLLCGTYELDPGRTHPLLRKLPAVVHLPGRFGGHQGLNAAVELLASELLEPRQGGHAAVTALLDLLFIQVLRAWHEEQGDSAWSAALADAVVGDALRHMHDSPESPWTVAELAGRVGLSRAAFSKRFKDLVGEAPLTYLTWWRMTVAAQLLEASDLSLSQVATRVGYSTEYAFGVAFKRELGSAPGRFRRARVSLRAQTERSSVST